jgi:hypothetical protein
VGGYGKQKIDPEIIAAIKNCLEKNNGTCMRL